MPTAIGDVVPALTAAIDAALPGVKVYHGPKPTSEQPSEFVTVAFDPEGVGDGVNTEQTAAAVGNLWVSESGDVTCSITCWTGNGTADTLLQRADDLYDLIDVALRADRYLGGVLVAGASDDINGARAFGHGGWSPRSTDTGIVGRLTFTVRYATLLTA